MQRVTLVTGRRGAGKSWHLAALAESHARAGWPVLVVEPGAEWPLGAMRARRWSLARTPEGLRRAAGGLTVYRPPLDGSRSPMRTGVEVAAGVAIERGGVVLVVPEIHLAARWDVGPVLLDAITRARHHGIVILADAQHPARVATTIRDDARWLVHASSSPRDRSAIVEAAEAHGIGEAAEVIAALSDLCSRGPGWYLDVSPEGSLTPRRA